MAPPTLGSLPAGGRSAESESLQGGLAPFSLRRTGEGIAGLWSYNGRAESGGKLYALARWDGACCDTTSPCVPWCSWIPCSRFFFHRLLRVVGGGPCTSNFSSLTSGFGWVGGRGPGILLLHLYRDTAEDPEEMHRLISHGT